jgi:23S rRNA (guanine2445-N2)-methyltransferase / 23S rRNA (guanine2069-N7)-methyltransferase
MSTNQLQLLAVTAFGLEAVVAKELKRLGYEAKTIGPGRLLFSGDLHAIAQTNLWLRAADRVLLLLDQFEAKDFGVLFDRVEAVPWEHWIPRDGAFPVNARSRKSQLSSVPAIQRMVKKAVAKRLAEAHGVDPLPETGATYAIDAALLEDQVLLTLDTTGDGLHRRGYRRLAAAAQLRETLAAALVLLSNYSGDVPLLDPFCGSGTIAIEAALIARNMAPGFNREFAAQQWPAIAAEVWQQTRRQAVAAALPAAPVRIEAYDLDEEVLSLARYHAKLAGVSEDIHFQRRDFRQLGSGRDYGCLITNPPYGERMGSEREIEQLYQDMPLVLRRLKTWSHYILTAREDFEQLVGQRATHRRKLFNGSLKCTYYQYWGPRPPRDYRVDAIVEQDEGLEADGGSRGERRGEREVEEGVVSRGAVSQEVKSKQVAAPVFGGIDAKAREQAELFARRLTKRARHFRRWPKQGIECYRLYDRDIPEVPLLVDRYGDRLYLSEYERPHERTIAEHADWLDLMRKTAAQTLDVPLKHTYLKRRQRQRGEAQYNRVDQSDDAFLVTEGGLKLEVNLRDYLDTGLFLDHRTTRELVRGEARGRRFLNLFCYTGSFTVYAAEGGASETVSVDSSRNYLQWAVRNLEHNGLESPRQHRFIRGDCMTWLRELPDQERFDLAVIDPPTFSNSKDLEHDFDVQRDHLELLTLCLKHLNPGGILYFSTNFRRFKFAQEALMEAASPESAEQLSIHEISRQTVPADFRNERIHRCWRIEWAE